MGHHVERAYERLVAGRFGSSKVGARVTTGQSTAAKRFVVMARSFDTGEAVAGEYDVAVANPRIDVRRYSEEPTAPKAEAEADIDEPAEAPPEARSAKPAATTPTEPEEEAVSTPAPAKTAEPMTVGALQGNAFTKRRVQELVQDNDLLSDIQSILTSRDGRPEVPPLPRAASSAPRQDAPPPPPAKAMQATENGHAIFEEIAAKMRYAQAYDLGAVELGERFDSFDADPVKG